MKMVRYVIFGVLLTAALAWIGASLLTWLVRQSNAEIAPPAFAEAWTIACEIADCTGIDPPRVQLMWNHAYRGGYNGDGVIHFNPMYPKDGTEMKATLVHEMLHYLTYQKGGIDYASQKDICDSENYSYTHVNAWLETIGREDLKIEQWWADQDGHRGYWKCIPWYPGYADFVVSEPEFQRGG